MIDRPAAFFNAFLLFVDKQAGNIVTYLRDERIFNTWTGGDKYTVIHVIVDN